MTEIRRQDCIDNCRKLSQNFPDAQMYACNGPRIRLDRFGIVDGKEIPELVCGSEIVPDDYHLPTVSVADYESTSLTISRLMELHALGMLPDQQVETYEHEPVNRVRNWPILHVLFRGRS